MIKIVIIGAPYTGKTTLINELESMGYKIVPESAIQVIDELNAKYGVEGQKKWRMENYSEFELMISRKQKEMESDMVADQREYVFLDNGMHGGVAYSKFHNKESPEEILDFCQETHYDNVFLLERISTFNDRSDTGRVLTEKDIDRMQDILEQTYSDYGFNVIRIPEMPVRKRAEKIISILNEDGTN